MEESRFNVVGLSLIWMSLCLAVMFFILTGCSCTVTSAPQPPLVEDYDPFEPREESPSFDITSHFRLPFPNEM